MPMHCENPRRLLATDGPSWNITDWPFMPEQVRQQMDAEPDRPKATQRLYGKDGRLRVTAGSPLPDDAGELLTEDEVLGRGRAAKRKGRRR